MKDKKEKSDSLELETEKKTIDKSEPLKIVEKEPEVKASVLDNISDDLIESQSGISDHAIEQDELERKELNDSISDLVDRHGNSFENGVHQVDSSGNPLLTPTGKLKIKAGRKKSNHKSKPTASTVGRSSANGQPSVEMTKGDKIQVAAKAGGKAAANLLFTAGVLIGGEEWSPIRNEQYGIDEPALMEQAFSDYFESQGMEDLPAGWALVGVIGMYSLQRFRQPKTKSRMGLAKAWITNKISNFKGKKKNGTFTDSRDDGERKDDTSKTTKQDVQNKGD